MHLPEPKRTEPSPLPAAANLVEVERMAQHTDRLRLPARFAKDTLEFYARRVDPHARVVEGPAEVLGVSLTTSDWALELSRQALPHLGLGVTSRSSTAGPRAVLVFDRHTVFIRRPYTQYLQRALEKVKPEELDSDGRPLPWIPAVTAHTPSEDEVDAHLVGDAEPLPPEASDPARDDHLQGATILRWHETLSRLAGYSPPELVLMRGDTYRHGFATGRVWFAQSGPRRVKLTTCPNSDLAEVIATLAHELAHPLAQTARHDETMKAALLGLVSRQFGARFFPVAATERIATVDAWVATGIRAALRGAEPPTDKSGDDAQVARAMGRLRKLRQLAKDQLGKPEGVAATAAGNDLVTLYGLGHYGVADTVQDEGHVVDRFVVLPDGAVWRRLLAHEVASYFDVFSLSLPSAGRMHFFGAYADVVAAEYLFSVSARRIERECEAHVAAWKKRRGKTTSAETRREKVSFCDSAAVAFGKKLASYRADDEPTAGTSRATATSFAGASSALHGERLERAEATARHEHARRGSGWSSAGTKTYRENEAGRAVGAAMEVLHGVSGAAPARLTRKG